jgi:hypothetical protein
MPSTTLNGRCSRSVRTTFTEICELCCVGTDSSSRSNAKLQRETLWRSVQHQWWTFSQSMGVLFHRPYSTQHNTTQLFFLSLSLSLSLFHKRWCSCERVCVCDSVILWLCSNDGECTVDWWNCWCSARSNGKKSSSSYSNLLSWMGKRNL